MSNHDLSWLKVLVIEDNTFTQDILRTILRHLGAGNVQVGSDGAEALKRIAAEHFDLLLIDWRIPTVDGCELTRRVRALSDTARAATPIIMITGLADAAHVVQAREAGIDAYLVKPISAQAVYARIAAMLESARLKPTSLDAQLSITPPSNGSTAIGP